MISPALNGGAEPLTHRLGADHTGGRSENSAKAGKSRNTKLGSTTPALVIIGTRISCRRTAARIPGSRHPAIFSGGHGILWLTEVIQQAVWLYHRFSQGLRDVELILAARGGQLRDGPQLGFTLRPALR